MTQAPVTIVDRKPRAWLAAGLFAAIAVGSALRLIFPADIEYKADEQWAFESVRAVLSGAPWPWLGLPSSMIVLNPGMSAWIFIALGWPFGVTSAPQLGTLVHILNVIAIVALIVFARLAIAPERREPWYWAAALWALNPLAIIFERKIWPPSVLPAFIVAMIACWWYRARALPAFAWGMLGALIGQVHASAWFLALALLVWTVLYDRRSVHWPAWLLGNVVAALPTLPWIVEMMQSGGQAPVKLHVPLLHGFIRWITQPFGFGIEYTLGAVDMRAFLAAPWVGGHPTYLMGLAHMLLLLLLLATGIAAARRARRAARPTARDIFIGHDNESVLLRAAFWGYIGLMSLITIAGVRSHRHYLVVVGPLMALWLARLVFWSDWGWVGRRPRAILLALCVTQGVASAGLIGYIHVKQVIAGEYGPTWLSQQPGQSR